MSPVDPERSLDEPEPSGRGLTRRQALALGTSGGALSLAELLLSRNSLAQLAGVHPGTLRRDRQAAETLVAETQTPAEVEPWDGRVLTDGEILADLEAIAALHHLGMADAFASIRRMDVLALGPGDRAPTTRTEGRGPASDAERARVSRAQRKVVSRIERHRNAIRSFDPAPVPLGISRASSAQLDATAAILARTARERYERSDATIEFELHDALAGLSRPDVQADPVVELELLHVLADVWRDRDDIRSRVLLRRARQLLAPSDPRLHQIVRSVAGPTRAHGYLDQARAMWTSVIAAQGDSDDPRSIENTIDSYANLAIVLAQHPTDTRSFDRVAAAVRAIDEAEQMLAANRVAILWSPVLGRRHVEVLLLSAALDDLAYQAIPALGRRAIAFTSPEVFASGEELNRHAGGSRPLTWHLTAASRWWLERDRDAFLDSLASAATLLKAQPQYHNQLSEYRALAHLAAGLGHNSLATRDEIDPVLEADAWLWAGGLSVDDGARPRARRGLARTLLLHTAGLPGPGRELRRFATTH